MSAPESLRVPSAWQRAAHWINRKIGAGRSEVQEPSTEDGATEKGTLAVLPFTNLSGDPEFDFYEFALADTLITELARLPSIIVRPSAAILNYSTADYDPCQAGRELKVLNVLSANFLRHGSRMMSRRSFLK